MWQRHIKDAGAKNSNVKPDSRMPSSTNGAAPSIAFDDHAMHWGGPMVVRKVSITVTVADPIRSEPE